jgi:hypothetical protein
MGAKMGLPLVNIAKNALLIISILTFLEKK